MLHRKKKLRGKGGFSLLECIVAITVLGLVSTSMLPVFNYAYRWNAMADQQLQDQTAVTEVTEFLMAKKINSAYMTGSDPENNYNLSNQWNLTDGSNLISPPADVKVKVEQAKDRNNQDIPGLFDVTVTKGKVSVTTAIRAQEGGTP